MKLITTTHNDVRYEFRLLERTKVIEITKDGKFTYNMFYANGAYRCSCPGSRYHHRCWHVQMLPQLMTSPSINEPWTVWAEDAGEMMYGERR